MTVHRNGALFLGTDVLEGWRGSGSEFTQKRSSVCGSKAFRKPFIMDFEKSEIKSKCHSSVQNNSMNRARFDYEPEVNISNTFSAAHTQ